MGEVETAPGAAIDRALAAWATEDLTAAQALAAICAELAASPGVTGGLVVRDADGTEEGDVVVFTARPMSARDRRLVERVARATAPWRGYHRKDDDGWRKVLGAEADRCERTWLAVEPVGPSGADGHAALVVMGTGEEHRDGLLIALPGLAKACAPIVAARRAEQRVRHHVHRLKNGLAAVMANIEYATDLVQGLEEPPAGGTSSPTDRGHLDEALALAHEAAKQMTAGLDALAALATSRRTE